MSTNTSKLTHLQLTASASAWPPARRVRLPNFSLRFSERRLLLAVFDLLMLNAAFFLALMVRSNFNLRMSIIWDRLPWFLLLSALWISVGVILNVYDLARAANMLPSLWSTGTGVFLTGLIFFLIPFATPSLPRQRTDVLLFPLLAAVGIGFWRILYARVFVQPIFHQRALVVGNGGIGERLARVIAAGGENGEPGYRAAGYHVLGYVGYNTDRPQTHGIIPFLGTSQDLPRLARELRPDELVLAVADTALVRKELCQAILDCREMGISITTVESLYERLTGRVPLDASNNQLSVALHVDHAATHRFYLALRRLMDIIVGLLGCSLMLLLMPVFWIANRLTSPGPTLYFQRRVGKQGKVFKLVKFRSMIVDAERHTGPVWAAKSDDRTTPIGRFLRKTRLDEIPQFWNVLRGEMSLIGPRPERPEMVAQLSHEIPFYRARHAIKPGISGWAQVKYKYGASIDDARQKLEYDLYYIKNQVPYLDLLVLLRTIEVVLGLKGR